MKNILKPEDVKKSLVTINNEAFASGSYLDLGITIKSLLKVSIGALNYIDEMSPDKSEISPMDVSVLLEITQKMIPFSELEMIDKLKESIQ